MNSCTIPTNTYCNEVDTVNNDDCLLSLLLEVCGELLHPRDETFVQLDWVTGNGTALFAIEHYLLMRYIETPLPVVHIHVVQGCRHFNACVVTAFIYM